MIHDGFDISHLDLSYEHKTQCPKCHSNGGDTSCDNLHIYGYDRDGNNKGFHCYTCGYHMNDETYFSENSGGKSGGFTLAITQKDLNKLNEKKLTQEKLDEEVANSSDRLVGMYRALDPTVCQQLGIRWKYGEDKKVSEMLFPATIYENGEIVTTGYKVRKDPKQFYSIGYVGKANLLAGQTKAIAETLIIVEGEIDLVSAKQMLLPVTKKYNKSINVVSSLVGANSVADVLRVNIDYVNKHKKIILCLDSDDAGNAAKDECLSILPKDRTYIANLRYKDPNEYMRYGDEEFFAQDVYWNASPVETDGIIGSGSLYEAGLEAAKDKGIAIPFHMSDIAHAIPKFVYDSIVLIVGSTSIGKTANLDQTMISIVMNSDERAAVLSLEASRKKFAQKMASRVIGVPMHRLSTEEQIHLQTVYKHKLDEIYYTPDGEDRFLFVDNDFDTIEEAQRIIEKLVKVYGVKIIIGDPIQNIIGNKTNEEQRSFMLFCEKLKKTHGLLFLFGTHTRKATAGEKSGSDGSVQKEDTIEGSGSISKSASTIITLSRNKNATSYIEKNTTWYSIPKNREFEVTGEKIGASFYRASCSKLYPFSYAEKHNFFLDDKIGEIIDDGLGFSLSQEEFDAIMDDKEVSEVIKEIQEQEKKEPDVATTDGYSW